MKEEKNKFNEYLTKRTEILEESYKSRELMRDIKSGLDTTVLKKKYIKRLGEREGEDTYNRRIENSIFHNITNRMIKINYNRAFGKESQITSDNEFIASLQDNFDGFKNSLTDFGKRKNKTSMYDSMAHTFIDLPENKDGQYRPNDKPRSIVLNNDDILGARVNDGGELTHLRFRIKIQKPHPENPFDTIYSNKIYVFNKDENEKVYFNIYNENNEGYDKEFNEDMLYVIDEIPLISYYPDDYEVPFFPEIIFKDLANKNLEYYKSSSDQTNILHVARVPILFLKGLPENQNGISIGASMALIADENAENADGKYIEINGGSINAGRQNLIDLISQMESLGLELMSKNATATSSIIDNAQNTSLLTAFAIKLQKSLSDIVRLQIKLKKATGYVFDTEEFTLTIDTKFSIVVEQSELQFMQYLRSTNDISGKSITNYAKSLGYLPASFDYEKDFEQSLLMGSPSSDFVE